MSGSPDLYLASRSPRRAELIAQLGLTFELVAADVDESRRAGEAAAAFVLRLAEEKARAGLDRLGETAPAPVLGADTAVVVGDDVLGKPRDGAEALAMLDLLSGRSHVVFTGVAVASDGAVDSRLSETVVRMRATSAAERRAYVATGEPMDKAGAYGIQGLAAIFIERIEGSYSGVMGLPLAETAGLLAGAGVSTLDAV